MKEIKTAVGNIYIERFGKQEEPDRIKVYDSNKKYLSYFDFDTDYTLYNDDNLTMQEYYNKHYVQAVKKCDSLEYLIDFLGIDSYTLSDNWEDLIEDIYGFDYDEPVTKKEVINNDYVNKIGTYYVLNTEW